MYMVHFHHSQSPFWVSTMCSRKQLLQIISSLRDIWNMPVTNVTVPYVMMSWKYDVLVILAGKHLKCDVYSIWLCHPLTLWLRSWRIIECEVGRSVADSPSWTSWTSFPHRSVAPLSCSSAHKPNSLRDTRLKILDLCTDCSLLCQYKLLGRDMTASEIVVYSNILLPFLRPKASPTDLFSPTQITITFTEHNLLLRLHFLVGWCSSMYRLSISDFVPLTTCNNFAFLKPKKLQWQIS